MKDEEKDFVLSFFKMLETMEERKENIEIDTNPVGSSPIRNDYFEKEKNESNIQL